MKTPQEMTHRELVVDLALEKNTIYYEIPLGSVWIGLGDSRIGDRGTPIADVITFKPSYRNFELNVYEVKRSRGDFLQDIKSEKYKKSLPCCHRFYYAVAEGVAEKKEVPEDIGLIIRSSKGWYRSKGAEKRELIIPQYVLISMLLHKNECPPLAYRQLMAEEYELNLESSYPHEQYWAEERLRKALECEIEQKWLKESEY